ncbi:unnamed protein product [Diabrotica balteata]|uniref:FAD dependent oxidoreductase domain-containing protein n=1 Tax=Diabrotica balteata TaxID=107213 RepID=A0A9N9T1F2_DIABA|nr:unnamed protein product [Diabrotica balteata]
MNTRSLCTICNKVFQNKRYLHRTIQLNERQRENPFWRTIRILGDDFKKFKEFKEPTPEEQQWLLRRHFPRHVDIVIVGGGAIGSAIAYWLKLKSNYDGLRVLVLDKDPTFKNCTTAISMGALTQQFSLSENIQLASYGAEFLRNIRTRLDESVNINFEPSGYLLLASENGASQLEDNVKLQQEFGAINMLLTPQELKRRYPYLDVTNVAAGSIGLEREGWFNAWDMLTALRKKSMDLGAQYITAEVVDFLFEDRTDIVIEGVDVGNYQSTNEIVVQLPGEKETRTIEFAHCIIASGHESTTVSKLAGIGMKPGMLSIPLPIEKRRRFVFAFNCEKDVPSINTPMIEDFSGIYFRREGLAGSFIVGVAPQPEFVPLNDTEEDRTNFFNEMVHPLLANRVPAFNDIKLTGSWSGDYDYNIFDGNGLVGPHPYYMNMYIATGFSDQGIQQAPGIGRAVSEMIIDGNFRTIDLTRLGFDRLLVDKPMFQLKIT